MMRFFPLLISPSLYSFLKWYETLSEILVFNFSKFSTAKKAPTNYLYKSSSVLCTTVPNVLKATLSSTSSCSVIPKTF